MKEIYRICKHGAQVCILAPYYQQGLNLANPYHIQPFNEHTPRFWTNAPNLFLEQAEYYHPHASSWGLSESDNNSPGIDFRCIKIEFFYFPEYRALPTQEKLLVRKQRLDVCDSIMYHLLVIKQQISEGIK